MATKINFTITKAASQPNGISVIYKYRVGEDNFAVTDPSGLLTSMALGPYYKKTKVQAKAVNQNDETIESAVAQAEGTPQIDGTAITNVTRDGATVSGTISADLVAQIAAAGDIVFSNASLSDIQITGSTFTATCYSNPGSIEINASSSGEKLTANVIPLVVPNITLNAPTVELV